VDDALARGAILRHQDLIIALAVEHEASAALTTQSRVSSRIRNTRRGYTPRP
jgi:hypothetical protein